MEQNKAHAQLSIEQAAQLWLDAKAKEDQASDIRKSAETRLLELVNGDITAEGSKKIEADGFKITVTGKVTRTVDDGILSTLTKKVPDDILSMCFKWKPALDLKSYRAACAGGAGYVSLLQSAVIVSPAKPSIKVEVM